MFFKKLLFATAFISIATAIGIAGYLFFAKQQPALAQTIDCTQINILCVDDTAGPSQEYSTIQAAVNVAVAGDTVIVKDGTYTDVLNYNNGYGGAVIDILNKNGSSGDWIHIYAQNQYGAILDGQTTHLTKVADASTSWVTDAGLRKYIILAEDIPVNYLRNGAICPSSGCVSGSSDYNMDRQANANLVSVANDWFYESGTKKLYVHTPSTSRAYYVTDGPKQMIKGANSS